MPHRSADIRSLLSLIVVPLGTLGAIAYAQTVLESATLSSAFMSFPAWTKLIVALGATLTPLDAESAAIPVLGPLSFGIVAVAVLSWFAGAWLLRQRAAETYSESLSAWGLRGWISWLAPGAWWLLWTVSLQFNLERLASFCAGTVDLWFAVAIAGWLAVAWSLLARSPLKSEVPSADTVGIDTRPRRWPVVAGLLLAMAIYVVVFTGMNWGLWFNLRLPHGDSAMYEEHLWNLEHGKGFRSYLDQGLFLGEHIQVIHVLLVPLHLLWPSQLLLELCESLALGLGAWPVFLLARRHTGSDRTALLLAVTYLLYFPLQYLDIAIDLKTFRPISFGGPLLLWAIDRMERGRYFSMTILLLLTLSAKEDYAIVICLLGVWLCLTSLFRRASTRTPDLVAAVPEPPRKTRAVFVGAAMAVFAGAYLLIAVKFAIPWFRGGETVHYARYFERFGQTPGEILSNMVLRPRLLFGALLTVETGVYVLRLLVPLALLPLLSPCRLLVGMPLLVLLCLNEVAQSFPAPVHHFHAPLLPILFWSAAAGLGRLARRNAAAPPNTNRPSKTHPAARLACLCALTTGLFWSLSPLGRRFWDEGSDTYWRKLYVPNERAREFERIAALIPPTAHVASTDFVHPRFTHCERSYDYSDYPRAVANYEDRVPDDTDYIVIDVEHPYNDPQKIAALRNDPYDTVRELIREPERWELLPETGNGYFLVLKRRKDDP